MRLPQGRDHSACGIGFVACSDGLPKRCILDLVLDGLAHVTHRGAFAADGKTSDGAGVLLPINTAFFRKQAHHAGIALPRDRRIGVAMVFLGGSSAQRFAQKKLLERACILEALRVCGWRDVPVSSSALGEQALASLPHIAQLFLDAPSDLTGKQVELRCYRARKRAESAAVAQRLELYVASFSSRSICYKALCMGDHLASFFPELCDPQWTVPFGIFHQRFSTNTTPSWGRAQPYRVLCHNGEINSIEGNERKMRARSSLGAEGVVGDESILRPLFSADTSDSGKLDAAVELLIRGGRELPHALALLLPEVWEASGELTESVRDFYYYHACLMEGWGGPAAIIATDGRQVTASLDRNGFRPLRWWVCEDGLVAACSEAGAIDLSAHGDIKRGRLGPGQMLAVRPGRGGFIWNAELKAELGHRRNYGRWIRENLSRLDSGKPIEEVRADLSRRQRCFGWTEEDVKMILLPMARDGKEPGFSMGDDTPPPVFGQFPRPLHHSFRQCFAQVTNPPIDSLRERISMSLRSFVGPRDAVLNERERAARLLEFPSFFVFPEVVEALLDGKHAPFPVAEVDATFARQDGPGALETACRVLSIQAERLVRQGVGILIIRDQAISAKRVPVPILLAVGAVHQQLIRAGLRTQVGLVCDSDEVRDTHHFATLLGYGADLVCPRLALEVVAEQARAGRVEKVGSSELAQGRYKHAVEEGVRKIMSKMGISLLASYRFAQLFEVVGIGQDVIDLCFTGTSSPIGGLTFEMLGAELLAIHAMAWSDSSRLPDYGLLRNRKGGEVHANNAAVVVALHDAVGLPKRKHARLTPSQESPEMRLPERYRVFSELVHRRHPSELQDLLGLVFAAKPIPIEQVEPVASICRRFTSAAMSHGAISREVHENLAIAMNRIGGRSNCGEGGEDRRRFLTRGTEVDRNSRIKQVASGRFGVTPEYCRNADELQIKMAQGSKPGEGGQIPGDKVTDEIASLRHTPPGIPLISPPPHHDIYSIEDLAQLIYDLKQVNECATVSVKLVATTGVGTIAAGVAKAFADSIHISGATGGTGSSALSSIKHAGLPWILGLAETQQALVANRLRGRVRLAVDGGLKTGRDVVVAALLGADEFCFGTGLLLAQGCMMVRSCHLDTCPTGIATQRKDLRAKFIGTPEMIIRYMRFVAQEVRELLAPLGFSTLDEAVGHADRLYQKVTGNPRIDSVDLSALLQIPARGPRRFFKYSKFQQPRSELGERVACDVLPALQKGHRITCSYRIGNRDRSVGATLGGRLAEVFGTDDPLGHARVEFQGDAGQSFGAFLTNGVEFVLTGEANDYVGKGMAGGRIVIRPPPNDVGDPHLAGNALLYGATGGELFVAGAVGERFAVRNCGALAVVEGAGRHTCEYMTGGVAVVLGRIGFNTGAGMTGGMLFLYDMQGETPFKLNREFVHEAPPDPENLELCRSLIARHAEYTRSERAFKILEDWEKAREWFLRVVPN